MKILFFCVAMHCTIVVYCQTYISPTIGIDYLKMESIRESHILHLIDNGYSNNSPIYGVKIKRIISKSIFISVASNYASKKVNADSDNFASIYGIKFNYIKNNLSFNYRLPNWFIGVGFSFNMLNNIRFILNNNNTFDSFTNNLTESDLRLSVGGIFKKFDLEFYYYSGLSSVNDKRGTLFLKPLASLGMQLSYNIKVLDKQRKEKRIKCPEF
ncbi:MAG: hypothetical protein IPP15_15105 [Saprospiraceae bacterium]|uniref:Outer membrane protein beta-barrel domain-containing protein n=1 Tax=Candidatus Opimibacter skivensis TaxID=2982028 RepID=A0A9D7XUF8_9BACT|nr:hypothetical protein [Candidatus Opimibacter skivensis]